VVCSILKHDVNNQKLRDASQGMITYRILGYVFYYQIFSFQVFTNRASEAIKSVWGSKNLLNAKPASDRSKKVAVNMILKIKTSNNPSSKFIQQNSIKSIFH